MSPESPTGHVLVLGLGSSGDAVARYLLGQARAGEAVRVSVVDEHEGPVQSARAAALRELGAEVSLGVSDAPRADMVVASPGIPPSSPLMSSARRTGAEIISEMELAYRVSESAWVAVTGTNGKTTTTSLIGHLLTEAGRPVEVAGNIGPPAIDVAVAAGPATMMVAEVSSFQLALTSTFRPRVAVLLNITEDHIDWHGSFEAYASDKARIFANLGPEDVAVIDVDDAGSAPYATRVAESGARVLRVSRHALPRDGAGIADGALALCAGGVARRLLEIGELQVRGAHNVSNALAAALAAHAVGVPDAEIAEGLRTFAPIEHRLEPVGVVGGVEYFNDSKATNPDATFKAIEAFEGAGLVLLLGGRNKGNDFGPLAAVAADACSAVVAFGEAREEIRAAFLGTRLTPVLVAGLAEAVERASVEARSGDAVVLSPACASFDEFTSYEHRGRVFKECVRAMRGGAS